MFLIYLIPKNWLSRWVGWAVGRPWPLGLHLRIRDIFIRAYGVDVSEAERPLAEYPTLGAFFVRRLRPGIRPLAGAALVSPVDGMLTQRGPLASGRDPALTQIKGISYTLRGLLGKGWDPSAYAGGAFLTLYLAPHNYHRIHAPAEGRVARARHIAGNLWPVNSWSVGRIPDLFVRNDRILVEMECGAGRLLLALVGATNVGRITLDFCPGLIGNSRFAPPQTDWKPEGDLRLAQGDALGCFEMGSTVVLVLDSHWAARLRSDLGAGAIPVRLGQGLSS